MSSLFQAILTSILPNHSHLIIRTPDHHISSIVRLVVKILSSLLGYSTRKHRIHSTHSSPDYFLSSLFLPLPHALVISGLEHASTPSQRALARVLTDKHFTLDNQHFTLPDGFILIYICSLDPRERPNIHKSLLDKFAMSCNILLKPHLRHQPTSVVHSAPSSPLSNTHISLPSSPKQIRHSQSHTGSTLPSPILSHNFIAHLRQAYAATHLSPTLSLYLADLFSATRHHPQIDGTLLTARCVKDAENLARAARVLAVDPTGVELLRGQGPLVHDLDLGDDFEMAFLSDALQKSTGSVGDSEIPVLDVTEVNIARIFPRCVSHRLRVRDGPREEVLAGAVFGATFDDQEEEGVYVDDAYEVRPTVKDILVSIMSEV